MLIYESNNFKYSKSFFADYKFRAKVLIKTNNDEFIIEIFTTNTNKDNCEKVLFQTKTRKVQSLNIVDWSSKEEIEFNKNVLSKVSNVFKK